MAARRKPAVAPAMEMSFAGVSPPPLAVGDVVQLKSGGCKMMVERLQCCGRAVNCLYWCPGPPDPDLGAFREISLDMALLHKVDPVSADDDIPF